LQKKSIGNLSERLLSPVKGLTEESFALIIMGMEKIKLPGGAVLRPAGSQKR
jgi:hypothetical protein